MAASRDVVVLTGGLCFPGRAMAFRAAGLAFAVLAEIGKSGVGLWLVFEQLHTALGGGDVAAFAEIDGLVD